ncbi:hypothetical protein BELL_0207g00170 [Botrytis elliptica]|uniref:Uncharacterized protein n=1 Tax=Botrytis elliptica TaxID=278938 RepID=A0A4Z1K2D6_9HELO|nr:hypothetical protein BELL_0207g00170 [Botrytis elliptica]
MSRSSQGQRLVMNFLNLTHGQGITTRKFYTAELSTKHNLYEAFFHTMIPEGNSHAFPQWFSSPLHHASTAIPMIPQNEGRG